MQCDVEDDVWSNRLTSALLHLSSIFSSFLHRMFFELFSFLLFFSLLDWAGLGVCVFFFSYLSIFNSDCLPSSVHPRRSARQEEE